MVINNFGSALIELLPLAGKIKCFKLHQRDLKSHEIRFTCHVESDPRKQMSSKCTHVLKHFKLSAQIYCNNRKSQGIDSVNQITSHVF